MCLPIKKKRKEPKEKILYINIYVYDEENDMWKKQSL